MESAKRMKIVGQIHLRPCAALFCFISSMLWSATLSKNALKSIVIWGHPWSFRGHIGVISGSFLGHPWSIEDQID